MKDTMNLRSSLELLTVLLNLYPIHDSDENCVMLRKAKGDCNHYGRLLVLEEVLLNSKASGECIMAAWKFVTPTNASEE